MKRIKRETIIKTAFYHIYKSENLYFVDLYRAGYPIHSYRSLESVKENLYYLGLLDSKDSEF